METSIELRYAGVVIGKATVSGPIDEGGENGLFVAVPDPLPVGTKVGLKIDDRTLEGRVIGVAESTDSAKCGMRIRIGAAATSATSASGAANRAAQSAPPAVTASSSGAPSTAAPAIESAPIDGAVAAESGPDVSAAHGEGTGDGAPSGGEEAGGQPGAQGGGRRRRRKR